MADQARTTMRMDDDTADFLSGSSGVLGTLRELAG